MKKNILIASLAAGLIGIPAHANWFTNDLTDATAVSSDFNEYISSHGNSVWSHTDEYALAQDGTLNTQLQGGAVLDWTTTDDDTARSYLGTIASDWLDKSWTAHIAVEAPSSTMPYIFFGLGDPTPNEASSNEPQNGDSTFVFWRSGTPGSKVSVKRNGTTEINTGTWQGDPGYDITMTYNHIDKTVQFEIDNWNGGRFSGVNVDTGKLSVDGYFSDTNDVHIFFGANAKVTFGDFYVKELFQCVHPGIPLTIEDLDAIKANLTVEPWATGYAHMLSDSHSSTDYVMRGPFETVSHTKPGEDNDGSGKAWESDMEAVHNLARMWYFTEEDAYAQRGRDILISWATNHTLFAEGETYLEMGYHAWQVFEGADILRGTWPGWTDEDTATCKTYFENVWWDSYHVHVPYPLRSANQGMANLLPAIGVAVFNDDEEKFNQCLQAFRSDACAALLSSLPNGQVGDSGRDGHSQGQLKLMAWAAEVFWKQGVDVYAEHDNRLLAASEYFSRMAMGFDTPFVTAGTVYDIYPDNNSLIDANATYFMGPDVFNVLHGAYVVRKGMSAPYLEEYVSLFEQDADSFHYLKAIDPSTAAIPAALTEPAPVASVTSLNGVNMGDCTSGSETYSSGTWTVSGRGTRMYYSSDPDYHFSYLPVAGDATIIAQLTGLSGGSATDARAGLVFTESTSNSDKMTAVLITAEDANDELQTWYRGETAHSHDNGNPVHGKPNQPKPRIPYWLKIERIGERITLFTSPDGASWSTAGCADYEGLVDTAYFGLAVSSDQYSSTATATFTDVRITGGDGGEASAAPEAPFAIYASPGGTEVPLRWLESFETDHYKIWRSTVSGGPYTLLTQESGTSFVDTNVVSGTRYYYAASAVNALGESALSPEDTFHYRPAYIIEAEDYDARGGNAREVGGCSDWYGGDKVGYISDGEWTRYDNITIGTGSVFRARVATGSTNTTGKIEVRLDSSSGTLIASVDVPYTGSWDRNWETIETAVAPVAGTHSVYLMYEETTAAGVTGGGLFDINWFGLINTNVAPDNLLAFVASPTQLNLLWPPVTGATEYTLKRSLVSGGPYTDLGTFLNTGYADTGLTLGTDYYYVVSAVIDGQESVNSAEIMASTGEVPSQTAMPFFTNDLTSASSVANDFDEYISSYSNAVWSYTNSYMVTDSGTTNTVLEGGAIIDWVTDDDDTARSYLGTIHSNYLGKSWTAHIGMEAPNTEKPYYFFGLGNPRPNEGSNHEPRSADTVYLKFQTGNGNSKVGVYNDNGATLYNSGLWRGDPGYDIWMTYNHINKTIQFDLDDWNGGRYSDIDISSPEITIDGEFSDTNVVHIFFGSNAKVCFRDFDIVEIEAETPPAVPLAVYTTLNNMEVELDWEFSGGADAYNVKRTTDSGSNYVTLANGLTDLFYTDTTVESNETYYYVVSSTNQFGESGNSAEATGVGLPYDIIGEASSYAGSSPWLEKDNLFDNDITTFYDTTTADTGAGLDFGTDNARQVLQIDYVLRNWGFAIARTTNATIQGANAADFSDAVTLYTVPSNVSGYPAVNTAAITNTTSFRYVRMLSQPGRPLYGIAEIDFITTNAPAVTANGTPIAWLESHDLTEADDEIDNDSDGLLTWEEYVAGTIPTNAASVLVVNSVASSVDGWVITWQSVEGKTYSVITNQNLVVPNKDVAIPGIPGEAVETSVTSSIPTAESLFFEIGVE